MTRSAFLKIWQSEFPRDILAEPAAFPCACPVGDYSPGMPAKFLLFVLVSIPALWAWETVTPEDPYPDLLAERRLYPDVRALWQEGPFPERTFIFWLPHKVATSEDLESQRLHFSLADNPFMRSRIVWELGECKNRQALSVLEEQLARETDLKVVRDILNTFHRFGAEVEIPNLQTFLQQSDWYLRRAAVRVGASAGLLDCAALQAFTTDPQPHVAIAAWKALVDCEPPKLAAVWQQPLTGNDAQLIGIALQGLARSPDRAELNDTVTHLATAQSPAVRGQVAKFAIQPGEFGEQLLRTLSQDANSAIRALAADAGGRLSSDAALEVVLALLVHDPERDVRLAASKSLGFFNVPVARDALMNLTGDPESARVRRAAADALMKHSRDAVDTLCGAFIDDDNEHRRFHCFRILRAIQSAQYGSQLAARLPEESGETLAALIDTVRLADYRKAKDALLAHTETDDAATQIALLKAISALQFTEGLSWARDHAVSMDNATDVRVTALHTLGALRDPDCAATIMAIFKQCNLDDTTSGATRAAAAWAASRLPETSNALRTRMLNHVRRPVLKSPEGPMFDMAIARVACTFALIDLAKAEHGNAALSARKAIAQLRVDHKAPDAAKMQIGLVENLYGYQAQQYWDNGPVTLTDFPVSRYTFSLQRLRKLGQR